MTDLPDSWADEPWPLDDPVPTRGLNPVNWSDTHDTPPQVADLADEAWEYAIDHGISMERALAELQRQGATPSFITVNLTPDVSWVREAYERAAQQVRSSFRYIDPDVTLGGRAVNGISGVKTSHSVIDELRNDVAAMANPAADPDALLDEIRSDLFPRRTLDQWSFSTDAHKTLPPDPGSTA